MEKFNRSLLAKILITIALYVTYRLGFHISLFPTADQEASIINTFIGNGRLSLFSLGFTPAVTGFLLIEIIFLIIPKLRAIRNNGHIGRTLINKWSIGLSMIIATFQSWTLVNVIKSSLNSSALPLIQDPNFLTLATHCLFFIAGFMLIIVIGKLITKYGIGNGFCIMIGLNILEGTYLNIANYIQYINTNNVKPNYIGFLILGSLLFFIYNLLVKKDWTLSIAKNETKEVLRLPFFSQGIISLTFAGSIYALSETLRSFGFNIPSTPSYGTWSYSIILTILTIITSVFGYWIFSSKKRISSNLSIQENAFLMDRNILIKSTLVLAALSFVFTMPFPFWDQMLLPKTLSLYSALVIMAIGIDVWNQAKVLSKKSEFIEITELDNVHLASKLKQTLTDSQISHVIQGFHYRRLYFFFDPFIKMKLLVPSSDKEKIQSIFNSLEIKNI